jgi:hypothetical protein
MVFYTTFNKAGNDTPTTPPRLVMYRLYGDGDLYGELWRFHDANGTNGIENVALSLEAPLTARETGEGAQLMVKNVVNLSTPSTSNPTELFTYLYYGTNGNLVVNDHDVRVARDRAETVVEAGHPGDGGTVLGPALEPVEARCLAVVVHQGDPFIARGVVGRQAGGNRALPAATFGIEDQDVTHESAALACFAALFLRD